MGRSGDLALIGTSGNMRLQSKAWKGEQTMDQREMGDAKGISTEENRQNKRIQFLYRQRKRGGGGTKESQSNSDSWVTEQNKMISIKNNFFLLAVFKMPVKSVEISLFFPAFHWDPLKRNLVINTGFC